MRIASWGWRVKAYEDNPACVIKRVPVPRVLGKPK